MTEEIRGLERALNATLRGSDWETLNELVAPDARIIDAQPIAGAALWRRVRELMEHPYI